MTLDLPKYLHHLDNYDMSETQKTEFIEAIAVIAESLADRAFGLDSIHQIYPPREPQNCSQFPDMIKLINEQKLNTNCTNDNEPNPSYKNVNDLRKL